MAVQRRHFDTSLPLDWDAGLRANILAMVSGPASCAVRFPARTASKARYSAKPQTDLQMIPSPRDPRRASGLRLVKRRTSRKTAATLSFAKTVFSSVAIGLVIGGFAVQDRLWALTSKPSPMTQVAKALPETIQPNALVASSTPFTATQSP